MINKTLFAFLLLSFSIFAHANQVSLEDILDKAKSSYQELKQDNKQRLERFKGQLAEAKDKKKQAKQYFIQTQKRSEALQAQFDNNEKKLAEIEENLRIKLGDLGELFGVVRQVAGDTFSGFQNSIITGQYPSRVDSVQELMSEKSLPNEGKLRHFWFLMLQDIAATGQNEKFEAQVLTDQGNTQTQTVSRIGPFNGFVGNQYAQYYSQSQSFGAQDRQPKGVSTSALESYLNQQSTDYQSISLDPSRGAILSLVTKTPSLKERLEQGGVIGYLIIGLGLLGLLLGSYRLITLWIEKRKVNRQLEIKEADSGNVLGRVMRVYQDNPNLDIESLELKIDEAIIGNVAKLERGIGIIKLFSAVAPLMGLLGTVVGMIGTFQAITLFGSGDPKLMAGGISEALVTTTLGLIVAIPLVFLHAIVQTKSKYLVQVLEEQATGYIAKASLAAHQGD